VEHRVTLGNGAIKVKLPLCLTKYHAMRTCCGSGDVSPCSLNLALNGGKWSRPLYSRRKIPGTHRIGGWLNSRAGLEAVKKKKCPCPCRESNPGRPTRNLFIILTELPSSWINGESIRCGRVSGEACTVFTLAWRDRKKRWETPYFSLYGEPSLGHKKCVAEA
jgi:hypothetical protein